MKIRSVRHEFNIYNDEGVYIGKAFKDRGEWSYRFTGKTKVSGFATKKAVSAALVTILGPDEREARIQGNVEKIKVVQDRAAMAWSAERAA